MLHCGEKNSGSGQRDRSTGRSLEAVFTCTTVREKHLVCGA